MAVQVDKCSEGDTTDGGIRIKLQWWMYRFCSKRMINHLRVKNFKQEMWLRYCRIIADTKVYLSLTNFHMEFV
jgi:hypothetical protein